MAEIYLAGGCFWGLEEYFSRIEPQTAGLFLPRGFRRCAVLRGI